MYVVATRAVPRRSGENGRSARVRRARERANGTATHVHIVTHYIPGSTETYVSGQKQPIIVNDVETHHPNCRTSGERPSLCDCKEFEWWRAGKEQ